MGADRPIVLSIAGFDPSAGAGILADIKTFEEHNVYGLGITTAQTVQTENAFSSVRWETESDILSALETMLFNYAIKVVKIGIVQNLTVLNSIVSCIQKKDSAIRIVLDTVVKSSSGFNFWKEIDKITLKEVLSNVFLITPNYDEILKLSSASDGKSAAQELSTWCNVLLKGGHNTSEPGTDYLFTKNSVERIEPGLQEVFPKHGSGCVLSAAITANLALGLGLSSACINAKKYTEKFLTSNSTLLGYHHA